MNKLQMNIWGRMCEIELIYQVFEDGIITELQNNTVKQINHIDFTDAKSAVIKYIEETLNEMERPEKVENIFRFVKPKKLFVVQQSDKRVFALLCNYKLDIEHGLAVVFENEVVKEVGPQDIIL